MTAALPAALPAGFTLEPATGAHAPEVHQIIAAEQVAAFGFCADTEEDARAELEPPPTMDSLQHVVRDGTGRVVQWWFAFHVPGDPLLGTGITSDPALPDEVHDELTAAGWGLLLPWLTDHAPDGEGPVRAFSGCPAGATAAQRRLAAAGFTHQRTFWEMLGPVTGASRTAAPVPGLAITGAASSHDVHGVLNEGFVGHWGFTPLDHDSWLALEESQSGFDPAFRFLATIDGVPAAAMVLSRRLETEDALYVAELATLAPYRRRGIAAALLAHACEIAHREGLGRLSLHVDSENSHDAPSVYRRAGLDVRCAFHGYIAELARPHPAPFVPGT
ncbi:GNAT family N-acetyltransferase [Nocardioides euryhalodurans]|uniref:GNAT family N-acetyltransferase n=1 Tax=Nocardioides euryhalodurans TaxID=2518370 RepID=A0A4P7GGY0_9ACTN|nr:GNAT family N-acetyltransferase [Nocardioides euryhalodurans]QBR91130.1 GNAT family N-acetyltransferase [Nocardioides euryhalodurans]